MQKNRIPPPTLPAMALTPSATRAGITVEPCIPTHNMSIPTGMRASNA